MRPLLSLFVFASALLFPALAHAQPKGPEITFLNKYHDFGPMLQGTRAECTFLFVNSGDSALVLTNVQPSCGCTVPHWDTTPLQPGDTGKIQVSYNSSLTAGPFNKTVVVESNAKNEIVTILTLRGELVEMGQMPPKSQMMRPGK